jgi:hypothetical protein
MDNTSNNQPMHENEQNDKSKKESEAKKAQEENYELQAMLYYFLKKRIEHNYNFKARLNFSKQDPKTENEKAKAKKSTKTQKQEEAVQQKIRHLSNQETINQEYKLFVTQICAVNPKDGSFKHYSGPHIVAKDKVEAQGLVDNTGLGYCEIIGELIGMIDGDGNDVKNAYRDN